MERKIPMASLHTMPIRRAEHIQTGQWYLLKGTGSDKLPMPPQVLFIKETRLYTQGLEIPYLICDFFVYIAGIGAKIYPNYVMPLPDINIPEHGFHDNHIELIDARQMEHMMDPDTKMRMRGEEEEYKQHRILYTPSKKGTGGKEYEPFG